MAKGVKFSLKTNIKSVNETIKTVAGQRMWAATQAVREEVLNTLSGPRSGRQYRVPGTNVFYTASAPGEPPAVRTGALRQSIREEVVQEGKQVIGRVGTGLDYGPKLEFGDFQIKPRPWLRRSFERAQPRVNEILTRKWF